MLGRDKIKKLAFFSVTYNRQFKKERDMEMQSVCVTKTGGFVDATNVARPSCHRLVVFTDPTALIFIGLLNRLVHIQPSHKLC